MKLLQWDFDAWEDYLYQSRQSTTSIGVTHRMGVETSFKFRIH